MVLTVVDRVDNYKEFLTINFQQINIYLFFYLKQFHLEEYINIILTFKYLLITRFLSNRNTILQLTKAEQPIKKKKKQPIIKTSFINLPNLIFGLISWFFCRKKSNKNQQKQG